MVVRKHVDLKNEPISGGQFAWSIKTVYEGNGGFLGPCAVQVVATGGENSIAIVIGLGVSYRSTLVPYGSLTMRSGII